jgi:hypothetical protein
MVGLVSAKIPELPVNDPRKLFVDDRLRGMCIFCGGCPSTKDHCPSKVLLDEPLPANLPVVLACFECNHSFSKDEQYLACFLECVICGSADPAHLKRENIKRILFEQPKLASQIASTLFIEPGGRKIWEPDLQRVRNVVVKLARGHLDYELSLQEIGVPDVIEILPIFTMTAEDRDFFECPEPGPAALWPEIGSRAFMRMQPAGDKINGDWQTVQNRRYRYLTGQTQGNFVHIAISEYLACRVAWE